MFPIYGGGTSHTFPSWRRLWKWISESWRRFKPEQNSIRLFQVSTKFQFQQIFQSGCLWKSDFAEQDADKFSTEKGIFLISNNLSRWKLSRLSNGGFAIRPCRAVKHMWMHLMLNWIDLYDSWNNVIRMKY